MVRKQSEQPIVRSILQTAERLSNEVLCEEEVRALCLETQMTFMDIANALIPKEVAVNCRMAQMIVSQAARRVLSPEELETVRARNVSNGCSSGGLSFRPDVSTDEYPELIVEVQGSESHSTVQVRWNDEEKNDLLKLGNKITYKGGMHEGQPCMELITHILNVRFHNSVAVRTPNSSARQHMRLKRASECNDV